jgi:DNA-binding LacI/PurR family transcriptional regulator
MNISIKDVARLAECSHSTVSRALADSPSINRNTAEKIRRIAREVGYRPNTIGRSLATKRTRTIGFVVTTVADPFVAEVAAGIEDVARQHNYAVFLANSNADPEREVAVVRSFQERRVDGVIVMASRVGSLYMPLLEELECPIMLVDDQHPGEYAHSISIDDRGGARLVTSHLAGLGHRRIAYIGDRDGMQSDVDRMGGYTDALEAAGIERNDAWVARGNGAPGGGLEAMQALLARRERPTAVFCYNDMTAIGALRALHKAAVRVPAEMSVAGFDDLAIASFLEPPLTTLRQPKVEMGRRAAAILLDLLQGKQMATRITVPGELVVRESTAPLRSLAG